MEWLIKRDWLGHIIEMFAISLVVTALSYPILGLQWSFVAGLFWGMGHFHGREKRDCEVKLRMPPPHLKAYWFGYWNRDQLSDFAAPLISGIVALYIIFYWWPLWSY
jgi:hypothetical protein